MATSLSDSYDEEETLSHGQTTPRPRLRPFFGSDTLSQISVPQVEERGERERERSRQGERGERSREWERGEREGERGREGERSREWERGGEIKRGGERGRVEERERGRERVMEGVG